MLSFAFSILPVRTSCIIFGVNMFCQSFSRSWDVDGMFFMFLRISKRKSANAAKLSPYESCNSRVISLVKAGVPPVATVKTRLPFCKVPGTVKFPKLGLLVTLTNWLCEAASLAMASLTGALFVAR